MLTTKDKIELLFELLGIIATFSAVFVALWQTKIQFKKRLKISVSEVMQLIEDNGIFDDATLMIELKISNIGNRDVVITDWGMCLSKKLLFQILNIHEKKLPETLKPEDVLYVRTPITGIQNCIIENRDKIHIYK